MMSIELFPIEQLRKSTTYLKYISEIGRCTRCKEMTDVLEPCCGAPVDFEGSTLDWEDLWSAIAEELQWEAQPDHDAQAKDDKIDFGGEKK